MRTAHKWSLASLVTLTLVANGAAAQGADNVTLFENVRIFDGKTANLSAPSNVLVRGNLIERISTSPIPLDRRATARTAAAT